MNVTVTGKHIDLGDAFRERVITGLTAATGKYFPNPLDAQVTVVKEGGSFRVDIAVHAARNLRMEATGSADEAYAAAEQAIERIAKRLRRHKRRLVRDHHHAAPLAAEPAQSYVISPEEPETVEETAPAGDQPLVIAEMATEVLTLSVGEAVMRLDLGGQPALMFRNAGSGQLNMIYRRPDGNVGWIDPAMRDAPRK
ncbi:MAG: ribosome hibernation-promoting factor, HPF/YfiA family [Elsteraceae bacterium]